MSEPEPVRFLMDIESLDTTPRLSAGSLTDLMPQTTPCGDLAEDDLPVFVPLRVLDECRQLTATANGQETGGILVGGLSRDAAGGEVFLVFGPDRCPAHRRRRIQSGLHAGNLDPGPGCDRPASAKRDHAGLVALAPRQNLVREMSAREAQEVPPAGGLLRRQDRLLHRTVFPAAYSVALVVNELADDEQTLSMFGWKQGMVVQRGFHVLDNTVPDAPGQAASHTQEEVR